MNERGIYYRIGVGVEGTAMKKIFPAVVLVGIALMFPQAATACSCTAPDDIVTAFVKASVVVAAEVIAVSKEKGTLTIDDNKPYEATFEIAEWSVDEKWKGPYHRNQRFKSRTVVTCCMCGRSVEVGELLLLYLSGQEPYDIKICGRTALLKYALKDIPILYQISENQTDNPNGN